MNSKERRKQRRAQEKLLVRVVEEGQKRIPQAQPAVPTLLSRFWKVFYNIVCIYGLCSGVSSDSLALIPRISAQPTDIFDPRDPSTAWITVTNDNNYWLNDVQYACVQLAGESNGWTFRENWVKPPRSNIGNLGPGDTETLSCAGIGQDLSPVVATEVATINFMVVVSFSPASMPYHLERLFRFEGACGPDGKCHIAQHPAVPFSETELGKSPYFKNRWERAQPQSGK